MSNVILTQTGLNYALSAFDPGVLITIKDCVPVYDSRIDTQIHDNIFTSASTYDSLTGEISAATYPTNCEILWKDSYYDLDTVVDPVYTINGQIISFEWYKEYYIQ